MANEKSAKNEIEKALSAKAKELGKKPTEDSIYSWLVSIGVHANTQNYDFARAWRSAFQDKKPFVRDEVPDSDIADLREAQRDANASVEQIYRRSYSTAVEKIRSEAEMRVDAATSLVAEKAAEGEFLLNSWRATERELDESRDRLEARENDLDGARLEIAELQGRLYASNQLIGKLMASTPHGGAPDGVHAPVDAGADNDMEAIGDGEVARAEQHLTDAITPAPVKPDVAELTPELTFGPAGDDDADRDRVVDAWTDAVSNTAVSDADTDRDQPPAIATPPVSGGQIAMPIIDAAAAVEPDGGDDDRG